MLKEKILTALIKAEGFVSGQRLSQDFKVSRAAIWKNIERLRQEGYPIEAVTNKGYRLDLQADVLSRDIIAHEIKKRGLEPFLASVYHAASIDSTNRWARAVLEERDLKSALLVADCQTAGRGRRGKTWLSASREGLWFSLLLKPNLNPEQLGLMTLLTGLAVTEALRQDFGLAVGIKWPNDILDEKDGLKLAGILCEVMLEDQSARAVIVGVGLNVQQESFPPDISAIATSMRHLSSQSYRRVDILGSLLTSLAERYRFLAQPEKWLPDYRRHCLTLGRQVEATGRDGQVLRGRAVDLDANGELLLLDAQGHRHTVRSGEVSLRGVAK